MPGLQRTARGVARSYRPAKRGKTLANPQRKQLLDARRNATKGGSRPVLPKRSWEPRERRSVQSREVMGASQGVADAEMPGLGGQLTRKVQAGEIDSAQAQRTAGERARLEEAYGPNWRQKVYGDKGYMQRVRQALEERPDDPEVQALYKQLLAERKRMLEAAS